ncbi:MAG: sugar ABC transporter permease [Chloroflexi bacterium HGW-Chloroflexi-2]|jgi:multiple sugar transport system permease protein|nr:MAG: sugar ABC transporter permease [Chloroflexi bacterium HGW-Chloroflexi-2]
MVHNKIRRINHGYLFVAPFIIGFLLFGLYPVYNTLSLSFTDATLMKVDSNFIGLKNFERLFQDKTFLTAVTNTWELWIMNFIPQLGIAMLLAVWFTDVRLKIKAGGVWRMLFYMPNLLMPAAIAALYFSLFSYYGPVNQFLVRSNLIPEAIDFLRNKEITRAIVVFIQWWMWYGQTTILLMAAMTSISISLYEAAVIDGANSWKMFRYITLPLIKPVMIYILVTSLVGGMQMFDIPMLLTDGRGSPANAILTNNIMMYMRFRSSQGHIGAASTIGVMIFIMTTFVALLIFYLLREKHDDFKGKSG